MDLSPYHALLSTFSSDVTSDKITFTRKNGKTQRKTLTNLHLHYSPSFILCDYWRLLWGEDWTNLSPTNIFFLPNYLPGFYTQEPAFPSTNPDFQHWKWWYKKLSYPASPPSAYWIHSPSTMLQSISKKCLPFITTIINHSITSGLVSTAFKRARVTTFLKRPTLDPLDITNYSPVSLLSFLSKVLESDIYSQHHLLPSNRKATCDQVNQTVISTINYKTPDSSLQWLGKDPRLFYLINNHFFFTLVSFTGTHFQSTSLHKCMI